MSFAQLVTGRFRERAAGEPYVAGTDAQAKNWLGWLLALVAGKTSRI